MGCNQLTRLAVLLTAMVLLTFGQVYAQDNAATAEAEASKAKSEQVGFRVGKLHLHPGLSLHNVYDTNVNNASDKYNLPALKPKMDDILMVIGSFRMDYPEKTVAFTMDSSISYARYFGVDDSDTTKLSALKGKARLTLTAFKDSVVGFTLSDTFTRAVDPTQVGVIQTNDRIHNTGRASMHVKPGGGQLRFFFGYLNDLERYDASANQNMNWTEHQFFLDWELEFLPKTAFFMRTRFGLRDYYEYEADPNSVINTQSPNAMPLRVMVGLMGRVTSKLLLNLGVGYGNSFSKNYESFNSAIAKAELTGQFTRRTSLKGGFERSFSPINTFSYLTDNKIYLEFKQWLFKDKFKIYLYSAFSIMEYGQEDQNIRVDANTAPGTTDQGLNSRGLEQVLTITPSLRYDFLVWLYLEAGYTLKMKLSDYEFERVDSSSGTTQTVSTTYYDFTKHQIFLKFTMAY